ncbi:MAG: class I SAM-dependent DNA methyltransferase, partial [Inhella sp.]|uniref:class I SAM-dependent DNA methyltransferase n=1 Tax=Inhella sp. TaxID=1921806 RepID=UPI003918BE39
AAEVLHFNGKLFKGSGTTGYALALKPEQVDGLLRAAKADWREVEPAIFGTLLERALDPTERHALGAHYTPRAYVERLVLPTVVEPLREDWANARAAALLLVTEAEAFTAPKDAKKREAKLLEARTELHRFHHQLCTVRVLDPACGSGNFLYITLEHLKRLEGEVLDTLAQLGEAQDKLELAGETVTLQQLRGIELNPRAAALAELVLWIGWLQWHLRTRGPQGIAEPVVHDYKNIECRDAVLAYDGMEPAEGPDGKPLLRWDGKTMKPHPVTGEPVPDETAQVMQWRYLNPRAADWPQADFIVGNPPFIGKLKVREALGDGYVEALRAAWPDVPDSADFVMYWWSKAASLLAAASLRSFGLITTNSIKQSFNRRVVETALASGQLSIVYAVPDHPWVDSAASAAVRIAMTVVGRGHQAGRLVEVVNEQALGDDNVHVELAARSGLIHPDLRLGANVGGAGRLMANCGLSNTGFILGGRGFLVNHGSAQSLLVAGRRTVVFPAYRGDDFLGKPAGMSVIDAFGFTEDQLRAEQPAVWQHLRERVFPERQTNADPRVRDRWWLFRRTNEQVRAATSGLDRFIVTLETTKHRNFSMIAGTSRPEHNLIVIASDQWWLLGTLSSQIHVEWALASGGTLESRPRYNKTRCFETFPFPDDDTGLTPELTERIRNLAEQLDAHRKARQAAHQAVTLTGLYNVLDKLRRSEALNAKDKLLHEQGLVGVLKSLHDDLDAAVLAAYGWSDLGPVPWGDDEAHRAWTETLLTRLVALNHRRAAEEAQGRVRWLRPEFQDPARRQADKATPAPTQTALAVEAAADAPAVADDAEADTPATAPAAAATRQAWPAELPAQMRAVADTLARLPGAVSEATLAEHFTGRGPWKKRLPSILQTLEALGRAQATDAGWRAL